MSDLLSQASLVMIPSGYKEDVVYSVVPSDGSGDLSFTRASNGTRVNSAGLVEVTPWNLVAQSESIGTSPWLLNGATLTSGQTDPSGGTTAVKVELASGGNNYVYQGIPFTNPINIVSAYLRADSATTIGFSVGGSTPNAVNLTTSWQLFTFSSTDTSGGIIFDNYFGPSPTQQAKTFYIWHPQLNIGSTAKPYFPTTDRLNVPRLTYQNGGGGCPSLLLEKQSTNVVTYSQQINSANGYNLSNVTSSEDSLTSPDGTINADKIIESTSNSTHAVTFISSLGGTVDSSPYCISVFVKAEGRSQILFYDNNQAVGGVSYFNLSTGVVTSGTGKIENYGNGWYRCTIFCLKDNSTSANIQLYLLDSAGNQTYTGNGTSGIGLWGYQCEASSYPTSYIPTTSSSATRVADDSFKTGISSLIGQTEGVLFADVVIPSYDNVAKWIAFLGAKNSTTFLGIYVNSSNGITAEVLNSTQQALIIYNSFSVGTRYKIALAYKQNDFAFYINGTQIGTDTSGTVPIVSEFNFNYQLIDSLMGVRNYNQVALFPTRLSNSELASLTTI